MNGDVGPKRRLHGFEWPFHPLQVLAWIVFGLDVLAYVVFGLPLVGDSGIRAAVAVLFAISVVVLVAATYRATACDPADPNVIARPSPSEETDALPFCGICNVPVFARSKHCRACAKCVDVFDHHCMWLNNCVGGQNYSAFFVTVSSVSAMIGIILGSCVYLLVDIFSNVDMFDARVQSVAFMQDFPNEFFIGVMVVLLVINAPLFVLDTQLVVLHIFLTSQNLTTYEYIMNKRSQEEGDISEGSVAPVREGEETSPSVRHVRTLPHWMDWIFFSRCGRRRSRKQKHIVKGVGVSQGKERAERERASVAPDSQAAATEKRAAGVLAAGVVEASADAVFGFAAGHTPAEVLPKPPPGVCRSPGESLPRGPSATTAAVLAASDEVAVCDRAGCGCDQGGVLRSLDRPPSPPPPLQGSYVSKL